jgi:hypothetical protein
MIGVSSDVPLGGMNTTVHILHNILSIQELSGQELEQWGCQQALEL